MRPGTPPIQTNTKTPSFGDIIDTAWHFSRAFLMLHGGMHTLKDIVQHEIFAENSANVPIFIIR